MTAPMSANESAELAAIADELSRLENEVAYWAGEAKRWRAAHASVVIAKRQLSTKYGAIMSRKPAARWRRTKKRIIRCVTKYHTKTQNQVIN